MTNSKLTIISSCITLFLLQMMTIDGFLVVPTYSVSTKSLSRQSLSSVFAKDKEEDLELTRQVIREYMEKAGDDVVASNNNAESESTPAAAAAASTATEEK
jgi:hypothetical protein